MSKKEFRTVQDSMGELQVPADALWGAQTQRAVDNFPIIRHGDAGALHRCARTGQMGGGGRQRRTRPADHRQGRRHSKAALEVADGQHDAHFPIDVFQTGSGTSSNMNANEVIATRATQEYSAPKCTRTITST